MHPPMDFFSPLLICVAVGALPAGFAAALAARRLAASDKPPLWATILAAEGLGLWAAYVMPDAALVAVTCALGWALIVLSAVDVLAFRLPDLLTLPLIVAGLAVAWWLPAHDIIGHAVGAAIGFGSFYLLAWAYRRARGRDGLGLGDAKLAGAAGAWLGWENLPFMILLGCAMGLVWVGIATIRRGREALTERIPFGVALCAAFWIVWLYGAPVF
jgi:leader peptidase (prepilin peptidase) / N-methyltransferase